MTKLETAVNGARAVSKILKNKYGFEVVMLENATRTMTLKAMNRYVKQLKKSDNLLIYYAGHGQINEKTKTGYWQPVDAEEDDDTNWISGETINNKLVQLRANNIIVIADSCYAGLVHRSSTLPIQPMGQESDEAYYQNLINLQTRLALTSGGNQPVVDQIRGDSNSIFTGALIDLLQKNKGILRMQKLALDLGSRVSRIASADRLKQIPEFKGLDRANHEGGDFLIVPKKLQK